jgi:hypothetical protein
LGLIVSDEGKKLYNIDTRLTAAEDLSIGGTYLGAIVVGIVSRMRFSSAGSSDM